MDIGLSNIISGLGSSVLGGVVGSAQNQYNYRKQRELMDAQNAYQTSERLAQQQYQTSERLAAQEFNLDMWNRNNAYNSPVQQLQRMSAAGVNPNAAVGAISGSQSSPVTTSPQSAATGQSSAAGAIPQQIDLFNGIAQGFKTFMEGAALRSQIKKMDTETEWLPKINDANIQKLIADRHLNEEQANQVRTMLEPLKNKTLAEIRSIDKVIQKYSAEIRQINQAIDNAKEDKQRIIQETRRNKLFNDFEADLQKQGFSTTENWAQSIYSLVSHNLLGHKSLLDFLNESLGTDAETSQGALFDFGKKALKNTGLWPMTILLQMMNHFNPSK